jgi:hypothetical protein
MKKNVLKLFLIIFGFSSLTLAQTKNTYFEELIQTIQNIPTSSSYKNFLDPQNSKQLNNSDLVNLLKTKQFGTNNYNPEFLYTGKENNFFKPEIQQENSYNLANQTSVTSASIQKLTENIETRNEYQPCAGSSNPLQCNRELFISCASSYEDSQIIPIQCERYSPYEYGDFINYSFQNPNNTVSDYFDSKLKGQNLLTNIEYKQNETTLKNIFEDKKGEKSGWATWFGHGPNGEYDKLAGTSQYGGWTGGCALGNKNPGCYQARNKNTCIVSIPKSTMQEFYGISGSKESIRNLLDSKPNIEVRNTANNKCTVAHLGDVGPGEKTGKAIDLTGCVMKSLGGSGMIHAHFRPLAEGEDGCSNKKEEGFFAGGVIEKVVTCNCEKTERKVIVVSDKTNRKRLVGVFDYADLKNFLPKEGSEILAKYSTEKSNTKCAIRENSKSNKCIQKVKGISGNEYNIINIGGKLLIGGSGEKNQISI